VTGALSRWRAVLMEASRMLVLLLPITGLNPLMFPGRLIGRLSCTQNRAVTLTGKNHKSLLPRKLNFVKTKRVEDRNDLQRSESYFSSHSGPYPKLGHRRFASIFLIFFYASQNYWYGTSVINKEYAHF
jgi:hypothetical protein